MTIPATITVTRRAARLAALALVLAAAVTGPGCARMRSFRQRGETPAFGTEPAVTAWRPNPPRMEPEFSDFSANQARKSDEAGPQLARSGRSVPPEATPSDAPAVPPAESIGGVALQPPVALTRAGDAPEVATTTRTTDPRSVLPSRGENPPASDLPPVAPSVASPAVSAARPAPGPGGPTLESVLARSRQKLDALSTYQVTMSGQERVGGTLRPPDEVLMSIRRNPQAVRLEWPTGPNRGREVIYAADANGGMMHVRMNGALGVLPRISMAPDSPMATRNSRHPITEAGFDTILRNMEEGVRQQKAGSDAAGKLHYAGLESAEGLSRPSHKVVRDLPNGERWVVFLDPETYLPALVEAKAGNGDLLERYAFGKPEGNVADLASAEAFSPDARWGPSKGLFQRLARAGADPEPSAPQTR